MGQILRLAKIDIFAMKDQAGKTFYERLAANWPIRVESKGDLESALQSLAPEDGLKEGEGNYLSRVFKQFVETGHIRKVF